jgi:hypothetical protein
MCHGAIQALRRKFRVAKKLVWFLVPALAMPDARELI